MLLRVKMILRADLNHLKLYLLNCITNKFQRADIDRNSASLEAPKCSPNHPKPFTSCDDKNGSEVFLASQFIRRRRLTAWIITKLCEGLRGYEPRQDSQYREPHIGNTAAIYRTALGIAPPVITNRRDCNAITDN